MEVVQHHPGLEVYERPPQSATQYSATSTTPPPLQQSPHGQHQVPYDPYYKAGTQSSVTYDGAAGNGQLPPAPPSQYYPDSPEVYQPKRRRGWILPAAVGLAVAVLVGAAVGGGLGASLKSCESNLELARLSSGGTAAGDSAAASSNPVTSATATVTRTVTAGSTQPTNSDGLVVDYAPTRPDQVGEVADTCSSVGANVASTSYNDKFSVLCSIDMGSGERKDASGATVYIADIAGIVAYSYRDCMDACASFSDFSKLVNSPSRCRSFTFRTGMAGSYNSFKSANCWLKNGTGASGFGCDGCISGSLKS
ncbi:uncharacterized protein B0I36DRAFT_312412 [Microdochium trichocladiopsis]|uniref:Apple domain-containing protein n=1 Tax=Microdochium trichocladiopsis TaxID=1682393 RepID=A0A9P8YJW5_9PEZI|nr:uncharacterized protein B0I36DRAFT_312412 [Microdochium trichocladiopsis]KAH7041238.1 hypothetical protein B0I36DRAFT_312412 [Microdochium trichocladiopsis]